MGKIRVIVVDDSPFNRKIISEVLSSSPKIEVVAKAYDGEDAIKKVLQFKPDVITLDLEMPRMDGFAVLRWLMANNPIPVLVVSAKESNRSVFKALDLGAVDFVVKPSKSASIKLKELENELVAKVLSIPSLSFEKIKERIITAPVIPPRKIIPTSKDRFASCIVIGASTGGPPAIQTIFSSLESSIITPIFVCQHMPPLFTKLFADRLNAICPLSVKEAESGEEVKEGHIYIAPGGAHMSIRPIEGGHIILIQESLKDAKYTPSADHLFASVSNIFGKSCLGIILTGMGNDGTHGSRAIKGCGGKIVVESEATAVIFGMPKEVIKAGLADETLPLNEIASYINNVSKVG